MPCDSDGLADPYIRAYLLPERSRSSKRRTDVAKNTLAPKFDERYKPLIDILHIAHPVTFGIKVP